MPQNKYEFISQLLETKNLTVQQKEKILILAKEEIRKDDFKNEELERRIQNLESILKKENSGSSEEAETNRSKNKKVIPKYIDPKCGYEFLFDYNQNHILKSTCHEIDSNELENINNYCNSQSYNFQLHLNKICEAYSELCKSFASGILKSKINYYLTGKGSIGQTSKKSPFTLLNWSSSHLQEWSKLNPGIPPNIDQGLANSLEKMGYESKDAFVTRNKDSIHNFSDFVIYFKGLFHIRKDNSLKNLILSENKIRGWNDKIEFQIEKSEFPENTEFFTDVESLIDAYNIILELIISHKINPKGKELVKLQLIEYESNIKLYILHVGGIYAKPSSKFDRLGTKYESIINSINGICNFHLIADFENENSHEIELWNKEGLWTDFFPEPKPLATKVGGVNHVFEIIKYQRIK
jgi:hypothetical protein